MNWRAVKFDWNHARAFLLTAEKGSLSAAALELGMTQPTLGRQVTMLEEELGVSLFERVGRGLELTPSGIELLEYVRAMGEAASNLSLAATGKSESIKGNVCISATDLVAILVLPAIVEKLRRHQPEITIELVVSNSESDLKRREADIAIRAFQPTQSDLIAKKIGHISAHLYASSNYLSKLNPIISPSDLKNTNFICDNPEVVIKLLKSCGCDLTRSNFPIVSESVITQWELVKKDAGVALLPDKLADKEPLFEKVLPGMQPFSSPIWLVVHRELRTNRRVRAVYSFLAEELSQWFNY